jgi:1-acyl-sn-glycerol-3-phosphate acyltransferase/cytidylate kinase
MRPLIKINQLSCYLPAILFLLFTRSQKRVYLNPRLIDTQHGYVIAANHRHRLDAFVIAACLPLRAITKLSPIYFMAYWQFFRPRLFRFVLKSLGAFPTREVGGLDYGLPFSIKTLAEHGTIFIFPEGKRVKDQPVQAHNGVSVMANEPDVRVILCHLTWRQPKIFGVKVVVSEPRDYHNASAQQILDDIYALK